MPRTLSQSPAAIARRERDANRRAASRVEAAATRAAERAPVVEPPVVVAPLVPGVPPVTRAERAARAAAAATQIAALVTPPVASPVRTIALRALPGGAAGLAIHKKHLVNGFVDAVVAGLMVSAGLDQVAFQLYDNRTGWLPTTGILTRANDTVTVALG